MVEDFEQVIKKVKELLQEKDRIEQVMERACKERGSVKEEILKRVLKEYVQKCESVRKRAKPLISELNKKLNEIEDNKKRLEAAKVGIEERIEELEFRRRIGDLDEDEYRQRYQRATEEIEAIKAETEESNKEMNDYKRAIEALEQPLSEEIRKIVKDVVGEELADESALASEPAGVETIDMINPEIVFTPRNAYIEILTNGMKYPLVPPVVTIGRAKDNNIVLEDPRVSRYHGRFEIDDNFERIIYRDLGSKEGSYLNKRKVVEAELKNGDRMTLGATEFVIRVE